jgi:hypothetical protein
MAMAYAATRDHAHELIDRMDPEQVPAAVELLERMLDPISLAFANASFEAGKTGAEEGRGFIRTKSGTGLLASMDDLLAKYGLTPEEFERLGQMSF